MEGDRLLASSKHHCKVCRKSFPTGRSLGGHMRTHFTVAANSSSEGDERQQSSYSLRENPKKTWRLSDSGDGDGEMQCAECGNEFLSWRAFFGHMRCHSEKPSEERREHGGLCGNVVHRNGFGSQFGSEAAAETVAGRRIRSKRTYQASPEDEDGAISLMLLSRGVRNWSSSCRETSDKNSAEVLETWDFVSNGSEKTGSESGDPRNGFKKMESRGANDGIVRDDIDETKKPVAYYASSDDDLKNPDQEPTPCPSKNEDPSSVAGELSTKTALDGTDHELGRNSSSVVERFDPADDSLGHASSNDCSGKANKKRSQFECKSCNKVFDSHQALGGHRASHKRMKGCPGHRTHVAENSTETDASSVDEAATENTGSGSSKANKGHQCLICSRFFSSGQALGGHKRSHLVATSGSGGDAAFPIAIPQQPLEKPGVLDLNLPADGSEDLKSWWMGGNLKHKPLLGVISN
ncbi:hypothetical protein OPV22_017347 [Ensete ventricosum]|uniref:C2H2-type domain-containing protein n=1 Tax=Ensete ventricosum TaxID=4639 RepID=A0AAV8QRW7_ENSVE|nr:hypothetical protein OPV22_017347 [Ensete ventricosum]